MWYGDVDIQSGGALTLIFGLIAFCVIFPPTEFISAGLTIEGLFGSFLGSENLQFVQYHIRRSAVTTFVHSLIPIAYYIYLGIFLPDLNLLTTSMSSLWLAYLCVSITLPTCIIWLVYFWSRSKWAQHPIAKLLAAHAQGHPWYTAASSVNVEFRRVDKFSYRAGLTRIYVTDSWLLKVCRYGLNLAHQQDVHLTLERSDEYQLHHESSTSVQFLSITVNSVNAAAKPFVIRLNSLDYKNLREKLQTPIRNMQNIVIQQSLSDKFLDSFRQLVQQNSQYSLPGDGEVDNCIGCMQVAANIKLEHNCNKNSCSQCYCRPMWCLDCMGKWFASRQDQSKPETWLGSTCPCPTCRAKFCMLDVSLLHNN